MQAWAFVIGINDYPAESRLQQLRGAVADAAEFAEWALHPRGGGVAPDHLYFWTCPAPLAAPDRPQMNAFLANPTAWPQTRPDFARAPRTQEICLGIDLVAQRALAAGADRLYVFFAGHGFQTKEENFTEAAQTCFAAGDYDPRIAAAGLIPCDDMERMLKVKGPPEIVVFLDSCRSDASIRVARPQGPWNWQSDPGHHLRLGTARAAQAHRVAYEVPTDTPSRGAFSTLLVNGLRDHRVNGRLKMQDLESFVTDGVLKLVAPLEQYPDFIEKPRPWTLVLATGNPISQDPDIEIRVLRSYASGLVLVGGPAQQQQAVSGAIGSYRLRAAPGAYVIEEPGGLEIATFVHLGPGDTHVDV